jgi:hypothetical protein
VKTLKAVAALAVVALGFPAAAFAHTGAATVSCTAATFNFVKFQAGSNTVNYQVTVDGATAAQGTYKLDVAGGTQGKLAVPLALNDTHRVKAYAWWGPAGIQDGHTRLATSPALADQVLHCPAAPPPPPALAPVAQAPVALAAPAPAPASAVAGVSVSSAPTARLAIQAACATRHVRVTVSARLMRQVRFSVNGQRARTVNVSPGARSVTALVALRRNGPAVQAVTTRVSFRNGAAPRTLEAPARRCTPVAVIPQFTG